MKKKLYINILKEIFRPVKLLAVIRNYKLNKTYSKKNVTINLYSSVKNSVLLNYCYIGSHNSILNSKLGRHTYTNTNTQLRNVTMGDFCSVGSNVRIGIGKHPVNMVSTHPAFYSNNKGFKTFADKLYVEEYTKCIIGNDVWIGSDVSILGNIVIGDGAVCAYGAVITKDVPPYAIVGGIPAKIIGYRFDNETICKLQKNKWWELEYEFLKRNYILIQDVDKYLNFVENN